MQIPKVYFKISLELRIEIGRSSLKSVVRHYILAIN